MTRDEERALVQRARDGDPDAFEALVTANEKQVYHLAYRMLGNEEDALDMSQEAFLRAYTSLDSFRGDSRFSVWLYRLTSNVCIDFLRSKKRRPAVSLTVTDEDEEVTELEVPDERFAPEKLAEQKELRESLSAALESLPPEQRQILLLREVSGLSYEEIGRALALEPGTVKSRIFRARKRLCKILAQSGNFSGGPSSIETGKEG